MTPAPLRREVEPPRRQTAHWIPILTLGSTAVLTLAMAIATSLARTDRAVVCEVARPRVVCGLDRCEAVDPVRLERDRAKIEKIARALELPPSPRRTTCLASQRGVRTAVVVRAVNAETGALAACMGEWAARTDGTAATMTVAFQVTSSGAIDDMAASGLDDRYLPTCLATAIRQLSLPAAEQESHFQVEVKYVEGQTRIATTRLDCDPR